MGTATALRSTPDRARAPGGLGDGPRELPAAARQQVGPLLAKVVMAVRWLRVAVVFDQDTPLVTVEWIDQDGARGVAIGASTVDALTQAGVKLGVVRLPRKTCTGPCGRRLPITAYSTDQSHGDGRCSRCKRCERERVAAFHRRRRAASSPKPRREP